MDFAGVPFALKRTTPEIRHYLDEGGWDPFQHWFDALRDPLGKVAIARRLNRMREGNLGDYRYLRDGVLELRLDQGPGYRVYFAIDGDTVVLLLGGGDKGSQARDIQRAVEAWFDYQERTQREQALSTT